MLSAEEQTFLDNLPPDVADRPVNIQKFSPKVIPVAGLLISEIKNLLPDSGILHLGASALCIAGQNDIDLYLLAKAYEFPKYLPVLSQLYGEPVSNSSGSVAWKFVRNDFPVELYLTDPDTPSMQNQLKVFEILKTHPAKLREYEQLKISLNGATFREYQTQKYEFYHRLLSDPLIKM